VYVAEEGGHLIRKISPTGKVTVIGGVAVADVGRPGYPGADPRATSSYFNWPRTLALGPDGNLYVADVFNMRIRAICLKPAITFGRDMAEVGHVYTIVGKPNCRDGASQCDNGYERDEAAGAGGDGVPGLEARLTGVRGMAFDGDGNLVFSDSWGWPEKGKETTPSVAVRHRIRVLAGKAGRFYGVTMKAGHVHTIAGKDGLTGFAGDAAQPALDAPIGYPQAVIVRKNGDVLFTEADTDRIRRISPDGVLTTFAGGGPKPASGEVSTYGDGESALRAYIGRPFGLAEDQSGNVYVTMRSVNLIRRISPDGVIQTIAGTDGVGIRGDHDARRMALNQPFDLAFLPDGSLLASEARGHRLLRFFVQWGL
jgi:sugar lactone lactonase YvrE